MVELCNMNYITFKDSNKYVMSLDSLDMALLPTFTARPDGSTSPWTANLNIGTKDYFEFHVQSKTDSDIFDDDDDAKMYNETTNSVIESQSDHSTTKSIQKDEITTICHICDIDIPSAYLTDHENSLKHKANLKITDAVLNRTTKHVLKKSNGYVQKNYSTYFCGPCASEVKLNDKHTHENSETHKRSVSLDEVLFEFVRLYTNHEEEDISAPNSSDDENVVKNELDSVIKDNTDAISDSKARMEEFEAQIIENYMELSDSYEENQIMISSNGCRVTVAEDNFYGFVPIANDHKFCIVCQTIVEDEELHKKSDGHLDNYIEPFMDKNFIRSLRHSRSHCVICNKIVKNINFHTRSDTTHDKLLLVARCFDENKPKVAQTGPVINVNNQDTRPGTGINTNGLDNRLDNSNQLLESMPTSKTEPEVTIKSNESAEIENKIFFCNPCNLKYYVNDGKSHLFRNRHVMNLRSILPYCTMVRVRCSELFCGVCYVYLEYEEVEAHVASNDHTHKYTNLLVNNHVIMNEGNIYCQPCDSVLLDEEELLHIEQASHGTKLLIFEERQVKLNSTQNTNANKAGNNAPISNNSKRNDLTLSYSDVCKNVPKNPNDIHSNNDRGNHKNKPLKGIEETADLTYKSEYLEVRYLMDATDDDNSLMCKVCEVFVPNIENNINKHVRGKKHNAAFKSIIDANYIEREDEKCFCKLCTVNIKTHNIFNHIYKKKHLALLGNMKKTETVEAVEISDSDTKDTEIDDNSDTSTVDNESVDELYYKFRHHFAESKDRYSLTCKICTDIVIAHTAENVVNHSSSKTHWDGYTNLLVRNLIREIEDCKFYCSVCDCFIQRTGEVNHAQGNRHTGKFIIYMLNRR